LTFEKKHDTLYTIHFVFGKGISSMTTLGIKLPKEFIDKAGITEASRVEISEVDGRSVMVRAKEARRHIPLAERLKDWEGTAAEPEAIDWGGPVGAEEW